MENNLFINDYCLNCNSMENITHSPVKSQDFLIIKYNFLLVPMLAILMLLLFAGKGWGQIVQINENFSYPVGNLSGQGSWTLQGTDVTNPIQVTSPGLIFPGYQASGIGLATTYGNIAGGQDLFKNFTGASTISSGSIYVAALVKVTSATRGGDCFLSFKETTGASLTVFKGRLYAKDSLLTGQIYFGVTKSTRSATAPIVWTNQYYSLNTTYLAILKYTFVTGPTNDIVDVFICDPTNPFPLTEPTPNASASDAGSDGIGQRCVQLRQGGAYSPVVTVDGIRDGLTWADAVTQDISAPVAVFNPVNGAINVLSTEIPTITFDEPIKKTNGSDITNSDLAALVSFKKTNASGTPVAFTATIDATKTIITITPGTNLLNSQLYYLAIAPVEDGAGNESLIQSSTFTTIPGTISHDATLSDLQVNGTTVTGFSPAVYTYSVVVPFGLPAAPTVTATTNFPLAAAVVTPAVSLPGATTVLVTAQDGTTKLTYTINFTFAPPSANSALTYIKWLPNGLDPLKQNIRVMGFSPAILNYSIEVPNETVSLIVDAEPDFVIPASGCPPATYVVTQPVNLTGTPAQRTATVICTAQDGITTTTYHVTFSKASASTVYIFKQGFDVMPPAGWSNTVNVGSSATNGMGFFGSVITYLTPKFKWLSPSDGGTLTTAANNGAGILEFFVKVLDKSPASNLHLYIEKSYDNTNWTLVSQDPMPLYASISQWHQVVLPVNDISPQIYLRFRATATTGDNSTGLFYIDDVSLSSVKTLNLTSVLLEGLYNGTGTMHEAYDEFGGPHFAAPTADQITVELHDAANYANLVQAFPAVNLSTSGTATVAVPSNFGGLYYITIKHRNSVETTTATGVSFAGTTINQSFTVANVYGGNLGLMIDGRYAIYAGDVNQDGAIDSGDFTPVDNDASNYASGYLVTDINGDGAIDSGDFTSIDNNGLNYIGTVHP
jgi:hypothetical protein